MNDKNEDQNDTRETTDPESGAATEAAEPEQAAGSSGSTQSDSDPGGDALRDHADDGASRDSGRAIAWLALLLALASGGLAGWQWWHSRTSGEGEQAQIEQRVGRLEDGAQDASAVRDRVESLESRFDELTSRQEEIAGQTFDPQPLRDELASLADRDDELVERVDAIDSRLGETASQLESRIQNRGEERAEALSDAVVQARTRMALMEVAGYLRMGQSSADLAGDINLATATYEQALQRLRELDDSRAERLRNLVARELESLRSVERTDWSALSGRLFELESGSADWPMALPNGSPRSERSDQPAGEESDSGWWSGVKRSMGSLVRVSPRDAAPLAPAAVESVRERVRLHLAAAQAAAARRNADELSRQSRAASELVRSHFDESATAVERALEVLEEAASVQAVSVPDLGAALAEVERRLDAS